MSIWQKHLFTNPIFPLWSIFSHGYKQNVLKMETCHVCFHFGTKLRIQELGAVSAGLKSPQKEHRSLHPKGTHRADASTRRQLLLLCNSDHSAVPFPVSWEKVTHFPLAPTWEHLSPSPPPSPPLPASSIKGFMCCPALFHVFYMC